MTDSEDSRGRVLREVDRESEDWLAIIRSAEVDVLLAIEVTMLDEVRSNGSAVT